EHLPIGASLGRSRCAAQQSQRTHAVSLAALIYDDETRLADDLARGALVIAAPQRAHCVQVGCGVRSGPSTAFSFGSALPSYTCRRRCAAEDACLVPTH